MKKCNCPECNKELIRLEPFEDGVYDFWCDNCDIDITITKNDETKDYSDSDYYWEKAELQDPVSHRMHVENYKIWVVNNIVVVYQYNVLAY